MKKSARKDQIHHDIAGVDLLQPKTERFAEYRRKWDENPINLKAGSFPLHLDIEATSACNLKCPFCATTYSFFHKGFMSWEIARKLLDEAGQEGLYACKFNFRGEPLLHKDLGKFISYAKEVGIIDVFFNTNAVLLTKEKAEMLIDSGLDRLTISFEGYEKETYEKNRVGAKFEEVVANVERLIKLRDSRGRDTPKVRVQSVLTPDMEGKLDDYVRFWKNRVDQVSYNDIEPSVESVLNKIKNTPSQWICPFPYQRMTVMWDGTLTACKNDYFGKIALGNLKETSVKECWTNLLKELREKHKEGNAHHVEACGECPLRMSEMVKRGEISSHDY